MVRINKYETSIFGIGPVGNAIFTVTFNTQQIPSEWWADYWKTINFPRWLGSVGRRYPFRLTVQPTPAQIATRNIFVRAIRCFARQPETGGAVPPDIGPRARTWWYDNDKNTPPIYFNYFMRETLLKMHAGQTADWCKVLLEADSYVDSAQPNVNFGLGVWMVCGVIWEEGAPRVHRVYLKTPGNFSKNLYLWIDDATWHGMAQRSVEVWAVEDPWGEEEITWNLQPALSHYIRTLDPPPWASGMWINFGIGVANSVCLKLADESQPGEGFHFYLKFSTREITLEWNRPYVLPVF